MITSGNEGRAVSTLGWVEHGAVWVFDAGSSEPQIVQLSDAKYLTLHRGRLNHFAAVHHWDGERVSITVQSYDDPGHDVSRMDVTGWTGTLRGDEAAWATLPSCYLSYLNDDATGAAGYFLIRRFGSEVEVSRLDWFDQGGYDHGYQGVVSVFEVPETGETLFGVQRSSVLAGVSCAQQRGAQATIERRWCI